MQFTSGNPRSFSQGRIPEFVLRGLSLPLRLRARRSGEEEFPTDGKTGARISIVAGAKGITFFPILLPLIILPLILLPLIILPLIILPLIILPLIILTHLLMVKCPRKCGRWRKIHSLSAHTHSGMRPLHRSFDFFTSLCFAVLLLIFPCKNHVKLSDSPLPPPHPYEVYPCLPHRI